ncbi:hypothetical protein [Arthrobacter methylotrophus]
MTWQPSRRVGQVPKDATNLEDSPPGVVLFAFAGCAVRIRFHL